jgi:pseudaminic acid synthase
MKTNPQITIASRRIGWDEPVYIIAEVSANHNGSFEEAKKIIKTAQACGADAVKIQTYTPDTITLNCRNEYFQIKGTIWEGRNFHDLFGEAYTPWDWQPRLKAYADELGITLFSSPFDFTAVDFLEKMNVPAYKIASFELVDLPLIQYIAKTGKPIILSTGMGTEEEIREAVEAARSAGCRELALLKCTSVYPAKVEQMNLRAIPDLIERFDVVAGLSDHTFALSVPVAAVTLGARIIEKHITLDRSVPGPDSKFSLEPTEFKAMVDVVRETEKALGQARYELTADEITSRTHRRSLFVAEDIKAGERFTERNVRSVRPGHGLLPKHLPEFLGQKAAQDIAKGTPLDWSHRQKNSSTNAS